jgi:hypothetical protein
MCDFSEDEATMEYPGWIEDSLSSTHSMDGRPDLDPVLAVKETPIRPR